MPSFLDPMVDKWNLTLPMKQEDYLLERGATEEHIDQLQIGAISGTYNSYAKGDKLRFSRWSHGLKRLRGYLSFPLHNMEGEAVGLAVRHQVKKDYNKFTLDDAKVSVYAFGLGMAMPHIWRTRTVWVVEGPFDWFPMQQVIPNVIATTTDALTWQQCIFVRRFCDTVVFCLDMDEAGIRGVQISKKRLGLSYTDEDGHQYPARTSGLHAVEVRYPFKDPGDFYKEKGLWEFQRFFTDQACRLGVAA